MKRDFCKNANLEVTSRSSDETGMIDDLLGLHQSLLGKLGTNWNQHSLVTTTRQTLSRVLYYDNLYKKIVGVPGVICEFGVQWGATMSQLISLRGIYEPYNYRRKIIGFDTFEGFVNVDEVEDGSHLFDGDYKVELGYENTLDEILALHEKNCPLPHIKKYELVKGDASLTAPKWLKDNPHAVIAMAIFDMDLYKPTKDVLETIVPRLTKGSVLVFDELSCDAFPGETTAVMEVLGLNNLRLNHFPHQPNAAWAVYE